jgi:hypothetical protein
MSTTWSPDGNTAASGATSSTTDLTLTGNLSVGGTSTVTGAATLSSTLSVTGNATFDTSTLFVDATNNRVGIGTASPANTLQVNHNIADGDNGILIVNEQSTITDGELLGAIGFDSADGNIPSSALEASAFIAAYAAENHGTNDKGGDLVFGTSVINDNDDTVSTEHMRIMDSGYVGIGSSTPAALLYVEGVRTSGDLVTIKNTQTDAANTHTLRCIGGEGSDDYILRAANLTNANHVAGVTECFLVKANGCTGINTTGSAHPLHVLRNSAGAVMKVENGHSACDASEILIDCDYSGDDDVTGAYFMRFQDSGTEIGSIKAANATTVAYATSSDYRLKEDLKDMADATSRINNLKLYDFKWTKDGTRSDGLLAHEAAEVYSQPVSGEKDAMTKKHTYYKDGETLPDGKKVGDIKTERDAISPQQIDYSKFVPLILKSIQELSAKITALENA